MQLEDLEKFTTEELKAMAHARKDQADCDHADWVLEHYEDYLRLSVSGEPLNEEDKRLIRAVVLFSLAHACLEKADQMEAGKDEE